MVKGTKTTIFKTLNRKLKIEQHEPTQNWWWTHVLRKSSQSLLHMWHLSCLFLLQSDGELMCSGRVGSPCSISGTCRIILVTNRWWTHVLRTSRLSLLHMWHLSCYSCYKPVVNSCAQDE